MYKRQVLTWIPSILKDGEARTNDGGTRMRVMFVYREPQDGVVKKIKIKVVCVDGCNKMNLQTLNKKLNDIDPQAIKMISHHPSYDNLYIIIIYRKKIEILYSQLENRLNRSVG